MYDTEYYRILKSRKCKIHQEIDEYLSITAYKVTLNVWNYITFLQNCVTTL